MVTIDEEGGRVSRVADILGPDPSARETAQTMTVEQTYQMALERGRGLKDLVPLWIVIVTSLSTKQTINAAGGLVVIPK
ncbi:hypothetical protein ABT116_44985, partial [Streptomyces sp. NPDC002130]